MGHKYVTAAGSVYVGTGILKSVVASPQGNGCVSAHVTLYNATAATATKEIMFMYCGSAPKTVSWNCYTGIEFGNLWCVPNCAIVTVVWD